MCLKENKFSRENVGDSVRMSNRLEHWGTDDK